MLKRDRPDINCSEMNCYIGDINEFFIGNYPWEKGLVITGSSREDVEDVVWGLSCPTIPPLNTWQYTNTHFWNADEGYDETHDIIDDACVTPVVFNCGSYPNSWTKMQKYMSGDFLLKKEFRTQGGELILENTFTKQGGGTYTLQSWGPIGFKYNGLQDLYNTGHMTITHYTQSNGSFVELSQHVDIVAYFNKKIVYEALGRMCHLLQDQCVPAHTHVDTHPDNYDCGDSYETRMGIYFRNWTYQNSGNYINPFNYDNNNPVRFLMYTSNQLTDFFASNDRDGDNTSAYYTDYMNSVYPMNLYPYYTYSSIFSEYGSNGVDPIIFNPIGDVCMKQAIRATAGLLYWFIVTSNTPMNNCSVKINNITFSRNSNPKIFWNETGTFTPNVTGTGPINYSWKYFKCGQLNNGCGNGYIPEELIISNGYSNQTFKIRNNRYQPVSCNYYQNCGTGNLSFYVRLVAYNTCTSDTMFYGQYVLPWNDNAPPPPGGGGCPYLYVWNNDTGNHVTDNNLLHRSEYPDFANQDITDKYKLLVQPNLNDGKYSIQIGEYENDHDYIDMVKLYAVDHPLGTKIGISEHNQIIMYDTTIVQSPDDANLNGSNITPNIQYYYQGKKIVTGDAGDDLYAHYDSTAQANSVVKFKKKYSGILNSIFPDSMALIGELDREPIGNKGWGGVATIFIDPNNSIDKKFAMRENMSEVIVPFSSLNDAVDHVEINWTNPFAVTYFAVVPVAYSGFDVTELNIFDALHSINKSDILTAVQAKDNNYTELDSADFITIRFDSLAPPQNGWVRDFVIETNGRYTVGTGYANLLNKRNNIQNNSIYNFALHTNYPNPFNPKTLIKYDIGRNTFVTLSVYNLLGQLISVLINENKEPGNYSVEFDGTNLPSGLYIYKIESSDYIESKKMLLVK